MQHQGRLSGRLLVLKFGSSVMASEEDLPRVVQEIDRLWRAGDRVLAVVSAFAGTTDQLLNRASRWCEKPEPASLALLVATGEATAASLLSIALTRAGVPARVLDPAQAGLKTSGEKLDAEPISLNIDRLRSELARSVVVLPGFIGRDASGDTTLLGRGGSDLTALFLADQLGGECFLIKDVDGLYTEDPARAQSIPFRFKSVNWHTALAVCGELVQQKTINYAIEHNLKFTIRSLGTVSGTEVCSGPNCLEQAR